MVPGPRTSASPGKLEMQLLRSEPELPNQTLQGWGPAYVFEQALEVMLGETQIGSYWSKDTNSH